jgi:hypothetical protein
MNFEIMKFIHLFQCSKNELVQYIKTTHNVVFEHPVGLVEHSCICATQFCKCSIFVTVS